MEPPPNTHLTDDELRDLLEERLPRRELAEGLIHLAACDTCRERFRLAFPEKAPARFRRWFGTAMPPETWSIAKSNLDLAIQWGSEKVRAAVREIELAESHWSEVACLDRAQRRLLVHNSSRFVTLGFAVILLKKASQTWLDHPEDAMDIADLSLSVLKRFKAKDPESMALRRANDLRARAYTYRANCQRILGNFTAAFEDFKRARSNLDAGTGDPIELANTLEFEGTFLRDRRLLTEALQAVQAAAMLYREVGAVESEGRMIVIEALVLREAGRPISGVNALERLASQYVESEMGSENFYRCQYNLVLLAIDAGMLEKARSRLPRVQRLVHQRNNRFDLIRLEWLEALLHDKSGEDEDAEAKYRNVQQFFLDEGIGYDAAFVSLDLAAFYLDRGRHEEARDLAAELTPVFLADDIHREAVASLLLFREALEREEATAALARATAKALREVQGRPPHRRSAIH